MRRKYTKEQIALMEGVADMEWLPNNEGVVCWNMDESIRLGEAVVNIHHCMTAAMNGTSIEKTIKWKDYLSKQKKG